MAKRNRHCSIVAYFIVVTLCLFGVVLSSEAAAVRSLSGFTGTILPANDDGSTGLVPLGFTVNFYGTNFNAVFVNNNGNVTFDRALGTFTPFGLTGTVAQIIAPFFADVDTRGAGSGLTTYGGATVNGRHAFAVNWIGVGYFAIHTDRLNSFQLVLIDRSDVSAGDFDIEFNYDRIQWETGDASGGTGGFGGFPVRVGFSNGSTRPGTYFELPGSGTTGAFLDSNRSTGLIYRSLNNPVPGRYLFRVRSGLVEFGGLLMSKSVDVDPAGVGSNLTYTIRIDNTAAQTAMSVNLTDELPAGMTYTNSTTSQGTATISNGVVHFALGDLSAGARAVATITVVPTQVGDFCNTVTATSTNGANGSAEVCSAIIPAHSHTDCITRNARYWFTHAASSDPNCATLVEAIQTVGSTFDLGFLLLPQEYRNGDGVKDATDSLIEALGFYWRSGEFTGEPFGTQTDRNESSTLCRLRKTLAREIIAAQANFLYLGTFPTDCPFRSGSVLTNFPLDLVQQARTANAGYDVRAIRIMRRWLRRFNSSGLTNDFPSPLIECNATPRKLLRKVSRDPTTVVTCPGINDICDAAEVIIAARLPFRRTLDMRKYHDDVSDPSCGQGGADAVWRIDLPTAYQGRHFTVDTDGSNFRTLISVWRGSCGADEVVCNNGTSRPFGQAKLDFRTDGTNSFYIVVEGVDGAIGRLNMKVTSP